MKKIRLALLLIATTALPLAAIAQTDPNDRMDRLERDIQLLQKQVARGEPVAVDTGEPITNANQLEARLGGIEEQIRQLRGSVEQAQNDVKRLSDNLDRFQKDTEFRLNQTPASAAPAPAASAAPAAAATPTASTDSASADAVAALPTADGSKNPAPVVEPVKKKDAGPLKTTFPTPRDHYNYAFRLLNQTQYEQAAESFDDFVSKYPKDALVGNAYYWGGETYYIRRDYVKASDYFRQGYEAMPDGPKAADNLYKLALSLNALDRGKEACVVLQQVVAKFKKTSTNISAKAEQELKTSGCRKS